MEQLLRKGRVQCKGEGLVLQRDILSTHLKVNFSKYLGIVM